MLAETSNARIDSAVSSTESPRLTSHNYRSFMPFWERLSSERESAQGHAGKAKKVDLFLAIEKPACDACVGRWSNATNIRYKVGTRSAVAGNAILLTGELSGSISARKTMLHVPMD